MSVDSVLSLLYTRAFKDKPTLVIQDAFLQLTKSKVALDFYADSGTNPYIALFAGPTGTKFGVPLNLIPPQVLEKLQTLTQHIPETESPNSCLYSSLDIVTTTKVPKELIRAHVRNTREFKGFKPFNCERETAKLIEPIVSNFLCNLLFLLVTNHRVAEAEAVLEVLKIDGRTKGPTSLPNIVYHVFEPALSTGVFRDLHQSNTPCVYSKNCGSDKHP